MQTFLPYRTFSFSAGILDSRRLNKQIVEAYQIITGRVPNKNHPACLMWKGHEYWLRKYIVSCCCEYFYRTGKEHSIYSKLQNYEETAIPEFLNDNYVFISHKVNLIRKGVNTDILEYKLIGSIRNIFKHGEMLSRVLKIEDFPEGYYWPIEPVGQRAKLHRNNWVNFLNQFELKIN